MARGPDLGDAGAAMRSLAAVALVAACRGDAPPAAVAPPPAPEVLIGVRVDGSGATPITIAAGETRDLWTLCHQYDAEQIVARGRAGVFARGPCAHPSSYNFALTSDGAHARAALTSALDGGRSIIAAADDVIALDVARHHEPAPVDVVGLTIVVPGQAPRPFAGAAFDALVPTEHVRRGVTVADVLDAAHVHAPGDVIVQGGEPPYRIKAAWLRDRSQLLALRRNHRGQLRFEHTVNGARRGHVKDVTALEIVPR